MLNVLGEFFSEAFHYNLMRLEYTIHISNFPLLIPLLPPEHYALPKLLGLDVSKSVAISGLHVEITGNTYTCYSIHLQIFITN